MQIESAIIGGTGVYDPGLLSAAEPVHVETPYGSVAGTVGTYQGRGVVFLPRHGRNHQIPPHRINYRANIWALRQLGVRQILATTAVGSLDPAVTPGTFLLPNDFIDFTRQRQNTFFDEGQVVHVDVTTPYCARLRATLAAAAESLGMALRGQGTYVCTDGPRFESPAEIRFFAHIGGTIVGMTGLPEVVLAREAEICYAAVCLVTNMAAGLAGQPLTHEEVLAQLRTNGDDVKELLFTALALSSPDESCACRHAVQGQVPLPGHAAADRVGEGGTQP